MADPYLTVAELDELGVDVTGESEARLEALVARFESIIERARGVAYTPRDATADLARAYGCRPAVELPHRRLRSATYTIPPAAAVPVDLDDRAKRIGRITGIPPVALTLNWSHGHDAPGPTVRMLCAGYVARMLAVDRSNVSRDVLSIAVDGGTTRYATPDWSAGRFTGFLDTDAGINELEDERPVIG